MRESRHEATTPVPSGRSLTLEDRIALSHSSPVDAAITSQATAWNATFSGSFRFKAESDSVHGFSGNEHDKVAGTSRIPGVGLVKLSGTIQQQSVFVGGFFSVVSQRR